MFNAIVVVLERVPRIVWRINEDALDLPRELLFQRPKGKKVELRLVRAAKPGHAQFALGVIGQEVFAEQYNGRLQQNAVLPHSEPIQDAGHALADRFQ